MTFPSWIEDDETKRAYTAWSSMKTRCTNANYALTGRYKERGINYSSDWETFENFLRDLGPCPAGLQLDRYPDNDGNYEPGNCRWATRSQNVRNSTTTNLNEYSVSLIKGILRSIKPGTPVTKVDFLLGKMFKVSRCTIRFIRQRRNWADVE